LGIETILFRSAEELRASLAERGVQLSVAGG
jgi:hypothetical protein